MSGHTYTVEFRIISGALDPASITRELGLFPCDVRLPGSVRADGKILDAMWAFNGAEVSGEQNLDWKSLEDGLTFVMDKLSSRLDVITRYQSTARLVWWCCNFQTSFDGGPRLSALVLRRLGEFGAELYIDNYFSKPIR